ncbi:DUF4221 domain-containing protein [Halosquirtibacter xylanolyticus]|uniref:DUF4221 family protein n=1 Tax=Halosquirtibacter xylanolyticus TaxID=3374599 RepID=UPI003749529F|nr:DUF4221 domain-containing protein [Prolixibacteraceae bacterium]
MDVYKISQQFLVGLLAIAFLFSCNNTKNDQKTLRLGEELIIPVSNQFDVDQGRFTYYHGDKKGEEYLIYYNKNNNVVSEVSLSQQSEHKLFSLATSGEYNVGDAMIVQKLTTDSFLVNSPLTYNMSWVDRNGHPVKHIAFLEGSSNNQTSTIWFGERSPFVKVNNRIYVGAAPDKDLSSISFYKNSNTLFEWAVETDSFRYFMPFPKRVQEDLWGINCSMPTICLSLDQKKLLLNYPMMKSLISYDLKTKTSREISILNGANYEVEPRGSKYRQNNIYVYDMTTPYLYTSLIRDPYRKVYYRIVEHGLDAELVKETRYKYWLYKDISVLVYNESFEQIGSRRLASGRYACRKFFVGEKGLYVQLFHPDNQNLSEDELKFQCFELK